MENKTIYFVLSPGLVGGAEIFNELLIEEMGKETIKTCVLVTHNIEYFKDLCKKFPNVTYLGDSLFEILKNTKLISISNESSVVSNGYHSLFSALLIRCGNLNKIKKHIDIKHGWVKIGFYQKLLTILDKSLSIFTTEVVCVNEAMLKQLFFLNAKFIKSGIQIDEFKTREAKRMVNIAIVGRMSPEKRLPLAIQNTIAALGNFCKIHIVGTGTEFKKCRALSCNMKNVIYYGFIKDRNKIPYNKFDILLINSSTEGCPLVALEAMSKSVYVVSTNVGCMSRLLQNNRGSILDINYKTDDLKNVVNEFINLSVSDKNTILKKAHSYVQKNHSIKNTADNYLKLL